MAKPTLNDDWMTDTQVIALSQAYAQGTKRIARHFEELIHDVTVAGRDYLAEGVR